MTIDRLATPQGELAIRRGGAAGAPALLWVHGYTLDATLWAPIWALLPEWSHAGIDLPGHGLSRAFAPGDGLASCAAAVRAAADAVGADRMVAMSFGATVALLAAAADPQRFASLVLAAPAIPGGPEDQDAADANQELLRRHQARGVGPWLAERWLDEPPAIFSGARRHPALFAAIQGVVARHRWGELAIPSFAPRADPGLMRRVSAIAADALLLLGDADIPSFVRSAELLRRRLPRGAIDYVPGAGHLALLERPEPCAARIRRHFAPAP